MDVPIPGLGVVKPWLPALNIGGIGNTTTKAIQASTIFEHAVKCVYYISIFLNHDSTPFTQLTQAIVKKEVSSARKRRSLKEVDRRRLDLSIPTTAHRGLRMLCSDDLLHLDIDCPVNTTANEFA